jgi:NAD(P)-dependent dehydrogenase (short-subunit alcohol dehydrogenase family)
MSDRITSPFGWASTARQVAAGHDLTGKVAIVTGAATGIGVETARALAERGAEVVIAARKPDLAQAAVDDINRTATGHKASWSMLDLSSFASCRAFGVRWAGRPLNILINNAAVMACPQAYTEDGLEMQIGTNHFGHYLLTAGLAHALELGARQAGQASRLVSLTSIGHRRSGIHWDDIHYRTRPYDKWEAYGQAKTANSLFAVGFHNHFKDRGVTANAVMPGGIMTPLQRHMSLEEQRAMGWLDENDQPREGFKSTEQGAATSVWAALGHELDGVGGLYLEDCAEALPWVETNPWNGVMPHALDPESAERLWKVSQETIGAG